MANKKFFLGMLVMVLVFGMALVGCADNSGSGVETWSSITSWSQIGGTWKGPISLTENELGLTIKYVGDLYLIINASARTMSERFTFTATFSGSNLDAYWPTLAAAYAGEGYSVDNSKHSVSGTETSPAESMNLSDFDGWQINQKNTKLKMPANDVFPETIFTKQ
jgi:hypothetical protein